jgi:hypothetical protein
MPKRKKYRFGILPSKIFPYFGVFFLPNLFEKMKLQAIFRIFVLGLLIVTFFFPSLGFAGLFENDEKRWDYVFKTLKKINLKISDLKSKDLMALKQAQGQMYSQLEEIQRILPSLQGVIEVNRSEIENRISTLLGKTEEIQVLTLKQEETIKGDLNLVKAELNSIFQTINSSLESQKTGIVEELTRQKQGVSDELRQIRQDISSDIKVLADTNSQRIGDFSNAQVEYLSRIFEKLNTQSGITSGIKKTLEEMIPAMTQDNKNTLVQMLAKVGESKKEITVQSKTNQMALTSYLNSSKKQNDELIKILENTLEAQQANQAQLDGNFGQMSKVQNTIDSEVKELITQNGQLNNSLGTVNASMARLQEISNQNSDKLIKVNELSLKTVIDQSNYVASKMDRSAEAISLGSENSRQTNEKLVKITEILKNSANQSKVFDQKLEATVSKVVLSEAQTRASDEKLAQLIDLFQANTEFAKKLESELNASSQVVEESKASVILANEKLAKLIEILKTIAASQGRVDEVVISQKQLTLSQEQIIASQQQMSSAQNQMYENQGNIVETQKILAKAQEQATIAREQIIRSQAEIKEALADLRRKANVNIARNDDIKKKQEKIEKTLKAVSSRTPR